MIAAISLKFNKIQSIYFHYTLCYLILIAVTSCQHEKHLVDDDHLTINYKIEPFELGVKGKLHRGPLYIDNENYVCKGPNVKTINYTKTFAWFKGDTLLEEDILNLPYSLYNKIYISGWLGDDLGVASFSNDFTVVKHDLSVTNHKLTMPQKGHENQHYSIYFGLGINFIGIGEHRIIMPLSIHGKRSIISQEVWLFENFKAHKLISVSPVIKIPEQKENDRFVATNKLLFMDSNANTTCILWQGSSGLTVYDHSNMTVINYDHAELFGYKYPFEDYRLLLDKDRLLGMKSVGKNLYIVKQKNENEIYLWAIDLENGRRNKTRLFDFNENWHFIPTREERFYFIDGKNQLYYTLDLIKG